jgi:hypothetical protein
MTTTPLNVHRTWAVVVALAILAVAGLLVLTGITTHQSHLADLQHAHDEMLACIQSSRPASDCRLIVYGSN